MMATQSGSTLDHANRIDFVYLFDVHDGNPNGDPDAGNAPRMDPETGQGLVTDVSLKRKVRDYVAAAKAEQERYNIYVKLHSALHERREPAYKALETSRTKDTDKNKAKGKGTEKDRREEIERARRWMCANYFDVRAFGAVMSMTEFNWGQVRGPLQLTFARSIDPIADLEQAIARKAVEKEDAEKQLANDGYITGTLGRKSIVPYALYRSYAYYNPHFARDTGFDAEDLAIVVDALRTMFEIDHSATRARMSAQGLLAFQHSSPLGNAPSEKLFSRLRVARKDDGRPARDFGDYVVEIDDKDLPPGVILHRLL
jgi:CRISPR-associated protein Csd2